MYSIVMLTAMSAGADVTPPAASTPHIVIAPVGTGCGGIVSMGCSGSCSGSCYGSSCHGSCHGGFLGLRSSGFLGLRSSCHGCTGCTGYSFHSSCHGSCYGSSCHGYSCFGSSCHGSCHGSSWGPSVAMPPYTLHGYNSGTVVYGKVTNPNLPPVMVIPVAPMTKPGSDAMPMGANLKFDVPADVKLFVDGKLVPDEGKARVFYTPALEQGKEFFYEVHIEKKSDKPGETKKTKVIVEAGKTVVIKLADLDKADGVAVIR